ncbi:hypothetical protein [Reichenbachiella sp.]
MLDKVIYNSKTIGLTIFLIVILIMISRVLYQENELLKRGVFTYGILLDIKATTGANDIFYKYYFHGDTLLGTDGNDAPKRSMIGNYYLVKLLPENPKISELLIEYKIHQIPDSIPYNGWKDLAHTPLGVE